MSDRYTKVYSMQKDDYSHISGCPVALMAGAILFDNQQNRLIGQLKFRNLSSHNIDSVKVEIIAYNSGTLLSNTIQYTYKKLNVPSNEMFGSNRAILLNGENILRITVNIISVDFVDGRVWNAEFDAQNLRETQNTRNQKGSKKCKRIPPMIPIVLILLLTTIIVLCMMHRERASDFLIWVNNLGKETIVDKNSTDADTENNKIITDPIISSLENNSSGEENSCSHSYKYIETEATCLSGGYATYYCWLCGNTYRMYEKALLHKWNNDKCERCGATKDSELDPMNNNILTINQIIIDINTVGGVEPEITYTNHTNKQIAYIYFTIKFYDRMGYAAYCKYEDSAIQRLKLTGPINAGETDTSYWDPVMYNSSTAVAQPQKIEIIFTDETSQTIICTGRYWYTGSYYGGDLHE